MTMIETAVGRRQVFPPQPSSAGRARAFAFDALDTWGVESECIETVRLLLSELVSNAIIHGGPGSDVEVRLLLRENVVRVEVDDGSSGFRRRRSIRGALDDSGRGLELVAALSKRWGVESRPNDHKVVWCEVSRAR